MSDMEQEINELFDEPITEEEKPNAEENHEEELGAGAGENQEAGEKAEEEKVVEKPSEGSEEETELVAVKRQNELLLQKIEDLAGKISAPKAVEKEETKTEAEKILAFLNEDDNVDLILDDREKFNALLVKVHNAAVTRAREEILTTIPRTVLAQVQQQMYLKNTVENFLTEHPQLKEVRKAVGVIANEVSAEHGDWDLPKVLTEVANRAYTVLGITKKVGKEENRGTGVPSFATEQSGKARVVDQKTGLQKEIDELLTI